MALAQSNFGDLSHTCKQPLSQNSRMSQAVLSWDPLLPLRFELLLGLDDRCGSECTLSCTTLHDTVRQQTTR